MMHPSRKGIYCDLCGAEVLIEDGQIEYYTIDMRKVTTKDGLPPEIEQSLELDFCSKCHDKLFERVHKVSLVNDEKRKNYGNNFRSD